MPSQHTVRSYDEELKFLSHKIAEMGGHAERMVEQSVAAIVNADNALAQRVISGQNYTIVIVTHSMQQAARVSQRTAMFHLGNLVEVGDTETMFTAPTEKRTQDYITGRFG